MFQNFDDPASGAAGVERLAALRQKLKDLNLSGFLVPRADEHQGEYVPPSAERLAWLTGFTGSAGSAVVLADEAAIFVDGRYTLQVRDQVDDTAFTPEHLVEAPPHTWLRDHLKAGDRIGYDPWLHTVAGVRRLRKACDDAGATLVAVKANPLDAVWVDRPAPPIGPVTRQPDDLAGEAAEEKLDRIGAAIKSGGADIAVLTQPDSIAWLFNIRGSDIAHTPLPLSFATVPSDGRPTLFIDGRKLDNTMRDYLEEHGTVAEPERFVEELAAVCGAGQRVLIDVAWTADAIREVVENAGGILVEGSDPVALPKAIKNDAELAGAASAHQRDGAAVARFLHWIDSHGPKGTVDEIGAAKQLEEFRAETGKLKEISFDTISGAGPNGAIVHYRVTTATNRKLESGSLYLVDSGAQYQDGTTDITRTIAIGTPSAEMRDRFTRVLKGHIAIASARFPVGASGAQLDSLARVALWKAGLDFDHGTGHGVGSYLSVHEGPQRISKLGTVALQPGMILSNEPGYYKTGAYGIRIENLEVVTEAEEIEGGDRPMMGFRTLTLAPIDRRLVNADLLTAEERTWLDAYHARVWTEIGPRVKEPVKGWLKAATAPIG